MVARLLGRALLLRGDLAEAARALDRSLQLVRANGWIALQPLPEALRGEVALRGGHLDQAVELLDHAFSLGCHIGDPCWEAFAARGRGLAYAAAGHRSLALDWLRDSGARATRVADGYVWAHAHCLDALAGALVDGEPEEAEPIIERLERIAAHGDMRELVVRAALHRGRLGDPSAVRTARMLGEAIDNPRLRQELADAA